MRVSELTKNRFDLEFALLEDQNEKHIKLVDVAQIKRGKFTYRPRNEPKLYINGTIPFIQTGDITKLSNTNNSIIPVQFLNYEGVKTSRLETEKCILITIAANIGDTAILNFPACFPDSLVSIKVDPKKAIPEYINYVLRTKKQYLNNLAPQTAQKNITIPNLESLQIPLPHLLIQQRLADMMDKAYALKKSKENEAKKLLDSIDNYVMDELGIKVETKEEKKVFAVGVNSLKNQVVNMNFLNKIHENNFHQYKEISIYETGKFIKGYAFKAKDYVDFGVKILRVSDFDNNGIYISKSLSLDIKIANKYQNFKLQKNDIVYAVTGTLGQTTLFDLDDYVLLNQNALLIRIDLQKINSQYLLAILQSKIVTNKIQENSRGGTQPFLGLTFFKETLIPLPPISIQQSIAIEITSRRARVKVLQLEAKEILEQAKAEFEREILD